MAPVIRISEATYEKLQLLAQPFVDTPDSVIARCVEAMLARTGIDAHAAPTSSEGPKPVELSPDAPGELKHTRLHTARFGEMELPRPNWNALLRQAHRAAFEVLGSLAELSRATRANIRQGRYEEEGFYYLPEVDLSIQGQDSNLCWENSLRLAKRLALPISVELEWYNKEGAAHPGQRGLLVWQPEA